MAGKVSWTEKVLGRVFNIRNYNATLSENSLRNLPFQLYHCFYPVRHFIVAMGVVYFMFGWKMRPRTKEQLLKTNILTSWEDRDKMMAYITVKEKEAMAGKPDATQELMNFLDSVGKDKKTA